MSLFKSSLFKKAVGDSGFYFLSQSGVKIVNILIIPFLIRIISVEEYGQYEFFLISTGLLTTLVGLGMDSGIAVFIVDKECERHLVDYLFTRSLFISVILIFFLWLVGYIFFYFFLSYLFSSLLLFHLTFLYLLFTYFTYIVFNFVRWLGKAKQAALISFFGTVFGVGLGFLLVSKEANIHNYILGLVLGNGIGFLISIIIAWKFLVFRKKYFYYSIKLVEYIRLSLPFVPSYLANNLMIMLDRIIILSLIGKYALGIYAIASRLAQIPNFLLSVVAKGFQPVLFANYQTPEGARLNKKIYNLFVFFLLPTFLFLLFFSSPLVRLFGGEKYIKAIPLLPYVSMSSIIISIIGITGIGYLAKKKTYYVTFIIFFIVLLNALINYCMVFYFGIKGVAVGGMLAICIGSLLYIYFSERLYSFDLKLRWAIIVYLLIIIISFNDLLFN